MLFNSGLFLFGFLPACLFLYFLAPPAARNSVLVLASLLFYAWAEPVFVLWAAGSALLDFVLGGLIHRSNSGRLRKLCVAAGVASNLSLLCWFKYATFAVGVLSDLLTRASVHPFIHLGQILLPIGISFIVFEKITYLVDIYRGTGRPTPNFWTYLLYVFYFPKLLAGPIIRYCDIERQILRRAVTFEDVRDGFVRFLTGVCKKVLIADQVAGIADSVFSLKATSLDFATAWVGVACFTLQIYFDFSGYSDMAIGLSRVFGFRLSENFNNPYLAVNFTDFWRRWHISLSTWIREYLYIPLGGNRRSTARTYFNLCLCFFLCGLWHGAAWPFIIWGIFHGAMLVFERSFWIRVQERLPSGFNRLVTLFLVMLSWVVFRSPDVGEMLKMYGALFDPFRSAQHLSYIWVSPDIVCSLAAGCFLVFSPLLAGWKSAMGRFAGWRLYHESVLALTYMVTLLAVGRMAISTFRNFIYFRF